MNRLTNKECYSYEDFVFSLRNNLVTTNEIDNTIYKKLKSLEDIEEELGIDLITLFNVLKSHEIICKHERGLVYHKTTLEKHIISGLAFDDEYYGLWVYDKFGDEIFYYTKNYGKMWALTRDELEDDRKTND